MKFNLPLLLLAILIFGLCQCKKEHVLEPVQVCKIVIVTLNAVTYTFTYNADGTNRSLAYNNVLINYAYNGNTYTATTTTAGIFTSKTTYTSNTVGLTTLKHTQNDLGNTDWTENLYEYNGNELSKQTVTTSNGGTPTVTTYTWANGNLITSATPASTGTYTYYTDKLSATGDYFHFFELLGGYHIYNNKNQVKTSIYTNGTLSNVSYTYDQQNKITAMEVTNVNSPSKFNYGYQCK